jgi:hypothetical protein
VLEVPQQWQCRDVPETKTTDDLSLLKKGTSAVNIAWSHSSYPSIPRSDTAPSSSRGNFHPSPPIYLCGTHPGFHFQGNMHLPEFRADASALVLLPSMLATSPLLDRSVLVRP